MQTASGHIYEFDGFQLDPAKRLLRRLDGTPVPLTPRAFDTLVYMVEHHDSVLDKERIMEAVWPDSIVEENNLAQAISKLRQVFGETPGSHSYIVTVPGRGYRFVAEVKERTGEAVKNETANGRMGETARLQPTISVTPKSQDATDTGATTEVADSPIRRFAVSGAKRTLPAKTGWLWAVAFLAVAIVGFAVVFFVRQRAPSSSVQPGTTISAATPIPEKSVAVLPFDNLSDDKQNAYFAAGVQDEITSNLARIAELKVISRTSANLYKSGSPRNSREIGQQLGVAHLLEGSAQRLGNRVRVNAQLIKAATGERLWTQSYDRPLEHVFAVEAEIAQTVAEALKIALLPAQIAKLKTPPTENAQAYDLFLRGEYEFHRAWVETAEFSGAATKAADYFKQATEIDPHFSLAYAAMARAQLTEYYFRLQYGTERRTDLAEAAKRNIDHSLGLTPDLATAHLALGEWHSWVTHDRSAAIEEFQRAINLDSHLTNAITRMASVAMRRGQPERAIAQLRAALPTNPREILIHRDLAAALQMQRRYAQAGESFARALALNPKDLNDIINSAWNFYRIGDLEAAERILESYPTAERSNHDFVEAKLGLLARKHDYQGMEDLVKKAPASAFTSEWSRLVTMAEIAQGLGWTELARNSFAQARTAVIAAMDKDPDQPETHQALASLNATLNRPEEAIREAQRAIELSERADNFWSASASWASLAAVYAKLGRPDDAFPILNRLVSAPTGFVIYAENLKHDPKWDRIRADPRFEKLVASLAPKEGRIGESVNR
jgi:TolB-like protein/DNA-binding winged helix-turn-helix (wHTH) protein/Tfp pilus assembly protein PilF